MEPAGQQRNRRINTCLECRRLKRRCSRTFPCTHCQHTSRECVFPAVYPIVSSPPANPGPKPSAASDLASNFSSGGARPDGQPVPLVQDSFSAWPDMCLRIGKLCITDRIGGLQRSTALAEIQRALKAVCEMHPELAMNTKADRFSAPLVAWFKTHDLLPLGRLFSSPLEASDGDFISLSERQQQILIDQYFVAVYPVCALVLREDLTGRKSLIAPLRLAVMFAAAVSLPMLDSQRFFGVPKPVLVRRLHSAATEALCRANSVNCNELAIFQALLIYLTPQFMGEVSRSHSVYVNALIRNFQIAGHDRGLDTDTVEARSMKCHLWHQLLFLNIRATEAVGPTRTLFDDRLAELPSIRSAEDIVSVVRYECYNLHRWLFLEREKVAAGTVPMEECQRIISQGVLDVRSRYLNSLDHRVPIQKYASLVGTLLLARVECMLTSGALGRPQEEVDGWDGHKSAVEIPHEDLRPELEILEAGVLLDTDPDLAPWAWYTSAYHQYHSVINPLIQVCLDTSIPNTDRFMVVLDHVFGPSSVLSAPHQRAATILRAIADNLASFLTMTTRNAALIPQPIPASRTGLGGENVLAGGFDFGAALSDVAGTPSMAQPRHQDSSSLDHLLGTLFSETDDSGNWLQFPPQAFGFDGTGNQDPDESGQLSA